MREERGASQVLFAFLPGQTADLGGRIWRVREWKDARPLAVDQKALRQVLLSAAAPWQGMDDGLHRAVLAGEDVEVVQVDESRGVLVDPYPRQYRCKTCGRITTNDRGRCSCGAEDRAQLHFVAFHECGRLEEPLIPKCHEHDATAMRLPGTTRTTEITFDCPVCSKRIAQGFHSITCDCGVTGKETDTLSINVHRAGIVFTPRYATLVNSPDPSVNANLRANGGDARALHWFISGMVGPEPENDVRDESDLRDRLISQGLSPELAAQLSAQAAKAGEVESSSPTGPATQLAGARKQAAEQALSLASATASSAGVDARLRLTDLDPGRSARLKHLYEEVYPDALAAAGLSDVTLIERFPVANLAFGFTRGTPRPGQSKLRSFRALGRIRCYGMLTKTEALLFQLDPRRILTWLAARGHDLPPTPDSQRDARQRLTELTSTPAPQDDIDGLGGDLLTLVHSYSHRAVRTLTTFAGTDRDALAEYLLPNLGGFVVYGTGGGTFDLGGLRAVLETTLDQFLREVVRSDPRCPLDPGCRQAAAACMACLHLGERSCERFNVGLDRQVLTGPEGYLGG